ncbi:HAD hydrolase-like protein [Streptomyces sp. NPDC048290]|uniref:HAD family hydrolase n=1 Tax=Streptomyces sp. NPDC048290 TaxID=3155811 RepID=UPI00341F490F
MTAETEKSDRVRREAETLGALIADIRYVLFDFDGPVCRLFAGYPASDIAADQVTWLTAQGLLSLLTAEELRSPDPNDVLASLAARHPDTDLILALEEHLTLRELEAARSAWPTPFADPLIRTWVATGARLAVVTNNSARTVERYLTGRGLLSCFAPHLYGRTSRLHLLKPHPDTLHRALRALGASGGSTLMIGDSSTDYLAARSAGVRFLGYASSERALLRLRNAGVQEDHILRSLEPLLTAVRGR